MSKNLNSEMKALNPLIADPKRCTQAQVPDLLKPNCRNFQQTQNVDTSILDPTVSRNDYIRFVLDRKGILHSNSKISLSMELSGDSHKAFFPFPTGVYSLIKKCVLRAGTTILDSCDSFGLLSAYENQMLGNDTALRKERIKTGFVNARKSQKVPSISARALNGSEIASKLCYDLGREFELTLATDGQAPAGDKVKTTIHDNQDLRNGSDFVMDLSTLFPSLRFTQLPLYMIDQPVIIELFLEDTNGHRICTPSGGELPVFNVDLDSPKLIADYIYYDIDTMNNFASQNATMSLPFFEHQLIRTNVNYNSNPSFTRNLGGAGKAISMIKIAHNEPDSADRHDSLVNDFKSDIQETGDADDVAYNVKVNDRFLFPVKVSNVAEQYVNTLEAEGLPLNLSAREYQDNLGTDFTNVEVIEEHEQPASFNGTKRFMSIYNLTGERVNNRGLELHLDVESGADKSILQNVWLQISKTLVLSRGRFTELYN